MTERCVCCGDIIPEGRQVCPACGKQVTTVDDLISRKALLESIDNSVAAREVKFLARVFVSTAPTIEAKPVKHGYWIIESEVHRYGLEDDVDEEFYLKCSECGREVWGIDSMKVLNGKDEEIFADYPYCHCGAKMDGGSA